MTIRVELGVLRISPPRAPLSRLDFRWRLSLAEQLVLRQAEREHPDASVRDTLAIMRETLAEVTDVAGVDVTDPRTQAGAALVVDVLVGAGAIDAADAPARLAALLALP
jgi:hypothetical protein